MIPPIADRFIAGESIDEAIDYTQSQNEDGIGIILNFLGEHHSDTARVQEDVSEYHALIERISQSETRAVISIKPTQIGIEIGKKEFRKNLTELASHAQSHSIYTWVDMEDSSTTEKTIDAVTSVSSEIGHNIGVCLQANLKRTPEDIKRVSNSDAGIRLVKGAYDEPESVAHQSKDRVDEAFQHCIQIAFAKIESRLAVATHDKEIIRYTMALDEHNQTDFEFQLLMGVRSDLQYELAMDYPVWQYAPYGNRWLSYFYRRIRERKENALFAARAVLDQVR